MAGSKEAPIMEICRRLGVRHPLSVQMMSVLADPAVPIPDVQPILSALSNSSLLRKRERAVAAWLITHGNWSEDQGRINSETLSEVLERAMQTMRPSRVLLRCFADGLLLSLLPLTVIMMTPKTYEHQGVLQACVEAIALGAVYMFGGAVVSMPYAIYRDNRRLRKLAPVVKALGQIGHPTGLAALATTALQPELRDVATSALQSVTTGLLPEDYGTLPLPCVPKLCSLLTNRTRPKTLLVILEVLTVIGDGRAIGAMEDLAMRAVDPEVREASSKLVPILQQRHLANQASSLLLRASHVPSDSEQTLLRATTEQPSDPLQLLRMAPPGGRED